MGLLIHHLRRSQSERIIWLCEELNIPYELKCYDRVPPAMLAPEEYKALSTAQTSPVIQDGDITLAESTAVIEYIIQRYGNGKLMTKPSEPNYADFLFWWHYAQASLGPAHLMSMLVSGLSDDVLPAKRMLNGRKQIAMKNVEEQLGKTKYLAGDEFTAADLINLFYFTTVRAFAPDDLSDSPNILRWIGEVGRRPAYVKAMEKGDPGFPPILGADAPKPIW